MIAGCRYLGNSSGGGLLDSAKLKFYEAVLKMRPEQLGMLVKMLVSHGRRHVHDSVGHVFWVDPISPFGLTLLKGESYEPQMIALIEKLLRPSDVFVDLGANEGYFSIMAAPLVPSGRVFAVEPQPALREVLLENVKSNLAGNVTVSTLAISDQSGEARLFLRSSINNMGSRLNVPFKVGFGSELVQTCTLADFCRELAIDRARLLKVDCEGAEIQIINGSGDLFFRHAFDVVALEYHPSICGNDAMQQADAKMQAWGYQLAVWNGQTIYYLPEVEAEIGKLAPNVVLNAEF
jgi:FkbM family methyltransferase